MARFIRISFLLLICFLPAFSCMPENGLRTGDIVFVGIKGDNGGEIWVHASIVDMSEGFPMIVDATMKHGVDRHPLDVLVSDFRRSDGSYPHFQVMRLKDSSAAGSFVETAKGYLGEEYDPELLPDNGRHYCTELVQDSYVRDGVKIFPSGLIDFAGEDGVLDPYWTRLFSRAGMEVPAGHVGTTPAGMLASDALEPVDIDIMSLLQ